MKFPAAITALALLAACSPAPEPAPEPQPASESTQTEDASDSGGMMKQTPGSSVAPVLTELTPAELRRADLGGELGCSFARELRGDVLFIGGGDVIDSAGAEGIAKVDGAVRRFAMEGTGGYSRMAQGARFTAPGSLSLSIQVTGENLIPEDPPVAMESGAYGATMTVSRDGEAKTIDGIFECGP